MDYAEMIKVAKEVRHLHERKRRLELEINYINALLLGKIMIDIDKKDSEYIKSIGYTVTDGLQTDHLYI